MDAAGALDAAADSNRSKLCSEAHRVGRARTSAAPLRGRHHDKQGKPWFLLHLLLAAVVDLPVVVVRVFRHPGFLVLRVVVVEFSVVPLLGVDPGRALDADPVPADGEAQDERGGVDAERACQPLDEAASRAP